MYFGKRSLDNNFVKNQTDIFKQVLQEEEFMAENYILRNGTIPFPTVTVSATAVHMGLT